MLHDDAVSSPSPAERAGRPAAHAAKAPRALLVEDDLQLVHMYEKVLRGGGFEVGSAAEGRAALEKFQQQGWDVVITDLTMPGMDGMELLQNIRQRDPDVPVIIITAAPRVESAMRAMEFGAHRYLPKPVRHKDLIATALQAVQQHELARKKRRALAQVDASGGDGPSAELEEDFRDALERLYMVYQPIVSWSNRRVLGYESLVRSSGRLDNPGALFGAARRIGRFQDLSRRIRQAAPLGVIDRGEQLFINIDGSDLNDDALYDPKALLSEMAPRVVLELTERVALDDTPDTYERVARLRQLGFALAIDDLGAGYASLSTFAALQPDVCKLDMSLVRNIDSSATKQKIVSGLAHMCRELGILLICEGVETRQECAVLVDLGCDTLQGYLFARPASELPQPHF